MANTSTTRRAGTLFVQNKQRGMAAKCPAHRVDELISLLQHARAFHTDDEPELKKTKTGDSPKLRAARKAEEEKAAADAAKAEKAKKKITFDIQIAAEEGGETLVYKPLSYLKKVIGESKKERLAFDTAAEMLAAYGSSKSAKKNLTGAEAAITGLVRTKRLTLLDEKLYVPKEGEEGGDKTEKTAKVAKTGTDD